MDGHNLTYYEDGKRQCVCNYKNGKQDGEQHVFYKNGQLYSNTLWEEGRLLEVKSLFNEQGEALEIGTLKNGNGDLFEYDKAGRKIGIRTFKNGKPGKKKRLN